jgi:hypothetical protein
LRCLNGLNAIAAVLGAENRGGHNKSFTDAQENKVAEFIVIEFVNFRLPITESDILTNLESFYRSFNPVSTRHTIVPEFATSHCLVHDFKERHQLSSRRPNVSHVAAADPQLPNKILEFQQKMQQHIITKGADKVGNADETAIYRVPKIITCVAVVGSDSVRIDSGANTKECWTFMPTILASGRKLPVLVCKVGTTSRTFANMHLPDDCLTHFNQTGWSDVEMINKVITSFAQHTNASPLAPSVLALDCYWSHYAQAVKDYAAQLNVILEILPPGCTADVQPLDKSIFGPIKSSLAAKWRQYRISTRGLPVPISQASKHFFQT